MYRLINEEVSKFDFLGMENSGNEDARDSILSSKDFQTNIVIDIINNPNDRNKFKKISTTFVNKDVDMFNDVEKVDLAIDMTYCYNEKDFELIFFLNGEKDGDDISFKDFSLKVFSKAGDQIKFDWVEKNEKLYNTLIEKIVSPFLD